MRTSPGTLASKAKSSGLAWLLAGGKSTKSAIAYLSTGEVMPHRNNFMFSPPPTAPRNIHEATPHQPNPKPPLRNPHDMALELVSGADFLCTLLCRAGPVDLRGFRGSRGRPDPENDRFSAKSKTLLCKTPIWQPPKGRPLLAEDPPFLLVESPASTCTSFCFGVEVGGREGRCGCTDPAGSKKAFCLSTTSSSSWWCGSGSK